MNGAYTSRTVLIVEDEAPVRDFFSRALQLSGFTVAEASTAETALGMIRADLKPDGVLLDLTMPGIGGFGFLTALQADSRHRGIPVAIVTGHILIPDEVRAAARDLGVGIYHKPVTLEELVQLTNELIERRIPLS